MTISVVICTWNRSSLLRQTLEQLTRLSVPSNVDWELVIVNNNCSDTTDQVIGDFARHLPIRRFFEPTPGKCHALNRALAVARGEWLVFTDDDVLVDEAWLLGFVETASRFPQAAAIGGPISPWFVDEPPLDLIKAFPELKRGFCGLDHGDDEKVLLRSDNVFGANMAVRAGAASTLRFDPRLGPTAGKCVNGDETDFLRRIRACGGEVVWSPRMRVRHYVEPSRMTLAYLKTFCISDARTWVRLGAKPEGRLILGAPAWLWKRAVGSYVSSMACLAIGDSEAYLTRLREHCHYRGMLHECVASNRRNCVVEA